ncbi:hypothetical protein HID58_035556 [Brassica napus]|uniref:Uncharacterized protein n=1 Tax=Brassica napus TaxID=3708 RepID=A0ABQ8C725_BRANA|nr:hypothetical protein HID58_035556 [Brassica napus]
MTSGISPSSLFSPKESPLRDVKFPRDTGSCFDQGLNKQAYSMILVLKENLVQDDLNINQSPTI